MSKFYRSFRKTCKQCNVGLIAPNRSEHVSELQVRYSWSCESCGHQFVTSDYLELDGA